MEKDLEKALDQATAELLSQKAEAARKVDEQLKIDKKAAASWVEATNRLYKDKFPSYETESLKAQIPAALVGFLEKFKTKIEERLRVKFLTERKIDWPAIGTNEPSYAREDPNFDLEKVKLVTDMNKGLKPQVEITYRYFETPKNIKNFKSNPMDGMYFGMKVKESGQAEWFISNRNSGIFSEEEGGIKIMVDTFAKVLISDDPENSLSYYDNSPPETYSYSGSS